MISRMQIFNLSTSLSRVPLDLLVPLSHLSHMVFDKIVPGLCTTARRRRTNAASLQIDQDLEAAIYHALTVKEGLLADGHHGGQLRVAHYGLHSLVAMCF